jgi:sterol desaturase/sphingolipid hydroxylase (fatty acid hydroxylase superfamily)
VNPAEAWSFAAIVASAALLIAAERRWPYNRGQRLFRTGLWTDLLFYNFLQTYVLGVVIGRIISGLDAATGFSRFHLLGGLPPALQLAFFVATHDFYIYCFHGLQHRVGWLWKIHEAHHSVPDVDWLSGARSHPLEILINQTVEFAPIVLLGASPAVAVWKGAVSAIWGMFIHSNLDIRLGALQRVINGPEMHRWHHSLAPQAQQRNFSTKLAIWDWLFGTAYFPEPSTLKASRYGLEGRAFPEELPFAYFRQVGLAFQREPRT